MQADLSPFRKEPKTRRWLGSGAAGLSIGFHVFLGLLLLAFPEQAKKAAVWVEVAIQEPKPPPPEPEPPPPEPEPEREKPKPKSPKEVQYDQLAEDLPEAPTEQTPPPDAKPVPRVAGLSANSFATGTGTNFAVRAGNSMMAADEGKGMSLEEAARTPRAYTSAGTPPKVRRVPTMGYTDAASRAGVRGRIDVVLTIDPAGKVTDVKVVKGVGYGMDELCVERWRQSEWRPATSGGMAVTVNGVPAWCTLPGPP